MLKRREDSAWKQGLKKFYGVSASRKWQKLAADIECVANGLKPAYLLDTLSPNPHLFRSFLDHVLSEQRGSGPQRSAVVQKWLVELRVVSLGSDVLLINKTAVEKLFQSSCVYVDISETENRTRSEKPDVHIRIHSSSDVDEQCRHWYSTLMATELQQTALEPSKSNSVILLSAPLEPDLNVCTLFGRLLGYPVVYWFPPSTDYCLDYVDLVRHQVTLSSGSHILGKVISHHASYLLIARKFRVPNQRY